MVSKLNEHLKYLKSNESLLAADILITKKFYRQAAILYWHSTRDRIFALLEVMGKNYSTSREAITIAVSNEDLSTSSNLIISSYIIGTMAEWDENFDISSDNIMNFKNDCISICNEIQKLWL